MIVLYPNDQIYVIMRTVIIIFEPHLHHRVVSLSKNINPSLVLAQPRKTRPFKTERLLIGRKESNKKKYKKMCLQMAGTEQATAQENCMKP